MNLFAIYIGGKTHNSLIEVHDFRVYARKTLEECFPSIRSDWWGTQGSLHIDCYGILNHVDGYDVSIEENPFQGEEKLYFVNLGGYCADDFSELHKNLFVVANSESKAKVKALQQIRTWQAHHVDSLAEVEAISCLNDLIESDKKYIHLSPSSSAGNFSFICKYLPLPKA